MDLAYKERQWFMWSMIASAIFGCLHLATTHIGLIGTIANIRALSLPNVMFILFRLSPVFLPILFIPRGNPFMAKILRCKIVLGLTAALCLFGVMWTLYFLSYESFRELFDFEKIYEYQSSVYNFFVGNYVCWGTYHIAGTFFSAVLFLLLVADTVLLHHHRYIAAGAFIVTYLFSILAPLVFRIVVYKSFYTGTWLTNNALPVLSMTAFTIGICAAARSDVAWLEFIWGELRPDEFDDDEDN